MRYEVKTDFWIKIMIYFVIVVTTGPAFFVPADEIYIYVLIIIPINAVMLWILYDAYLEFRDEELFVKLGPIHRKVRYDNIKSISLVKSYLSSYAMTNKRVYIKIHKKTWITGDIQVGPLNREEFIDELRRRCRNLDKD